jgi:hypothetical protein
MWYVSIDSLAQFDSNKHPIRKVLHELKTFSLFKTETYNQLTYQLITFLKTLS